MGFKRIFTSMVLASLLSGWMFFGTQQNCLALSPAEEGIRHYNAGRFQHAVVYLSQAASQEPNNAQIHYYLANALVQEGMHSEAVVEYEICYRLDPWGPTGKYSAQALERYTHSDPSAANDSSSATAHGASFGNPSVEVRDLSAKPDRVAKTETIIRRQAAYEKVKSRWIGEDNATRIISDAERRARQTEEDARLEALRALEPPVTVNPRGGVMQLPFDPELARAKAEEVRRNAEAAIGQIRKAAQNRASEYRGWSKDREYALDEVVANLESQLEEPKSRSGVKLQTVGTDLYVRYYGNTRASRQLEDVHPGVVRIVEHGAKPPQPEGDSATPGEPIHVKRYSTRHVHGKILK